MGVVINPESGQGTNCNFLGNNDLLHVFFFTVEPQYNEPHYNEDTPLCE